MRKEWSVRGRERGREEGKEKRDRKRQPGRARDEYTVCCLRVEESGPVPWLFGAVLHTDGRVDP